MKSVHLRKSISPIVASLVLLIIAVSIAIFVIAIASTRGIEARSIIDTLARDAIAKLRERISIAFVAVSPNKTVVLGIMNIGRASVKILAIYVNGSPITVDGVLCSSGEVSSLPIEIGVGELCILRFRAPSAEVYRITIATEFSSYELEVYRK